VSGPAFLSKIVARREAPARLAQLPGPVVFTNGVFDVLHRGHVTYLAQARAVGGSLVVALNTDASARRLGKGPDRPLNKEHDRAIVIAALESVSLVTWFDEDTPVEHDRAIVIAALESVSLVTWFDEDTPVELLSELRPQVYVKGGDYDMRKLAETALVEGYGGRALAIPFVDGYSTTNLVQRIKQAG
jgi:D-glycero-beta-D-manno-heptose 1-phosphate adenylyltransferase